MRNEREAFTVLSKSTYTLPKRGPHATPLAPSRSGTVRRRNRLQRGELFAKLALAAMITGSVLGAALTVRGLLALERQTYCREQAARKVVGAQPTFSELCNADGTVKTGTRR